MNKIIKFLIEFFGLGENPDSSFNEYCAIHDYHKPEWGSVGRGVKYLDCPYCVDENSGN